MPSLAGVCLDCGDAEAMARFYGALLGWEVTARDEPDDRLGGTGWIAVADPRAGPVEDAPRRGAVDDIDAAVALVVGAGHPLCLVAEG